MKQRRPSLDWGFFRAVPLGSSLPLFAAAFFTFSSLGFLIDVSDLGAHPATALALEVLGWGLVGAGYLFSAIWSRRTLPLVVVAHVLLTMLPERLTARGASYPSLPTAARQVQVRVTVDAVGSAAMITLGYACFMVFVRREGSRYLADRTEIALARTVHQILVPPISARGAVFEFHGASAPSGDVGGDLVDLVRADQDWIALVADVSGHGVAAGVVMGMFKSAARMRLRSPAGVDALLTDLNRVLFDLKAPNMFITCACVRRGHGESVEFGLAGHLPILHFKRSTRTVDELSVGHVPLGILEDAAFPSGEARLAPGDLLVLATDGLSEVVDGDGDEFGLERLKRVVIERSDGPLAHVFDAVMSAVRAHGRQLDDQTLLLVRRSESA